MTGKPLNRQELSNFCEQFAMILQSGLSPDEGLFILLEDADEHTRKTFEPILTHLEENGSLSSALEESRLFPQEMLAYVKAGEETGTADRIFKMLSTHYQEQHQIFSYIKSAVSYPLLMLGMMIIVIGLLLANVLPVFQQVFEQMGLELGRVSSGLLKFGTLIRQYSIIFLILFVLLILFCAYLGFTSKGRELAKKMLSSLPVLRDINKNMNYSRAVFGIALGGESGLGYEGGIELAEQLTDDSELKEKLVKTKDLLYEGYSFSEASRETRLFSGSAARMIAVGDRTGSSTEMLEKLSEQYDADAMEKISKIVSTAEPTIVIILSILVGMVLISVMLPLLGILSEMLA